jgi:hypothetical protein
MHKHPVCGMTVDPNRAAGILEFAGQGHFPHLVTHQPCFLDSAQIAPLQGIRIGKLDSRAQTASHGFQRGHSHGD